MNISKASDLYPSRYFKATELTEEPVRLTIADVQIEEFNDNGKTVPKGVLYFEGEEKGLVLNKTKTNSLATAYGDDFAGWVGQPVSIFYTTVSYQGATKDSIGMSVRKAGSPARPTQRPQPAYGEAKARVTSGSPRKNLGEEIEDEIPFTPEFR